jgi:hypothetical protein
MSEIKKLPLGAKQFEANGNTYHVHTDLTIERYRWLDKLQVAVAFGGDYENIFSRANRAYDLLNAGKMADAAVALNGLLESANRGISDDEPTVLQIGTLFLSKNEEPPTAWSEAWASSVINDIATEGYSMSDFFNLALECQRAYNGRLASNTPIYSEGELSE